VAAGGAVGGRSTAESARDFAEETAGFAAAAAGVGRGGAVGLEVGLVGVVAVVGAGGVAGPSAVRLQKWLLVQLSPPRADRGVEWLN
jgi:hypothetical protein